MHFKNNDVIIKEGELSFEAYIIAEGQVEVTKGNQVLGALGPNEIFGEIGWLLQEKRTATCTAKSDRVVLNVLKEEEAISFLKTNPSALKPVFKSLATKLRSTLDLIEKFNKDI